MTMTGALAFTSATSSLPCIFYYIFRKSHIALRHSANLWPSVSRRISYHPPPGLRREDKILTPSLNERRDAHFFEHIRDVRKNCKRYEKLFSSENRNLGPVLHTSYNYIYCSVYVKGTESDFLKKARNLRLQWFTNDYDDNNCKSLRNYFPHPFDSAQGRPNPLPSKEREYGWRDCHVASLLAMTPK